MYYDGTLKKDIKFPPGSRLENSTNGPSFKPFFRRSNNYIDGRGYKSVSDHFTLRGKVFHIVRPSSLGPHKLHGSALSAVCLLSGHEMAANTTLSFDEFPTSCFLFRHFSSSISSIRIFFKGKKIIIHTKPFVFYLLTPAASNRIFVSNVEKKFELLASKLI